MNNDHEKRNIARAIRSHLERSRLSREELTFKTKLGKSTVDKLLTGLFSNRTLSIVEETLQARFRNFDVIEAKADASFGGYLRSDVSMYEGPYLFIRPSFKEERVIFSFPMRIEWDKDNSALVLRQATESNNPQFGAIIIPKVSFHLFVHSSDASCTRHLVLSRLDNDLKMRGLMLTLANTFANSYVPVSLPVVLIKTNNETNLSPGRVEYGEPMYGIYKQDLSSAEERGLVRQVSAASF